MEKSYEKMEAVVRGKVSSTDGSEMIIECSNGRLVKINIDPIDDFKCIRIGQNDRYTRPGNGKELTIQSIIGNEVYVNGWCYFLDGEMAVFAEEIEASYKSGRLEFYSINSG